MARSIRSDWRMSIRSTWSTCSLLYFPSPSCQIAHVSFATFAYGTSCPMVPSPFVSCDGPLADVQRRYRFLSASTPVIRAEDDSLGANCGAASLDAANHHENIVPRLAGGVKDLSKNFGNTPRVIDCDRSRPATTRRCRSYDGI